MVKAPQKKDAVFLFSRQDDVPDKKPKIKAEAKLHFFTKIAIKKPTVSFPYVCL